MKLPQDSADKAAPCGWMQRLVVLSSFRVILTGSDKTVYDLMRAADMETAIIAAMERNPGMTLLWAKPEATIGLRLDPQESSPSSDTLCWELESSNHGRIYTRSCDPLAKTESLQETNADQS